MFDLLLTSSYNLHSPISINLHFSTWLCGFICFLVDCIPLAPGLHLSDSTLLTSCISFGFPTQPYLPDCRPNLPLLSNTESNIYSQPTKGLSHSIFHKLYFMRIKKAQRDSLSIFYFVFLLHNFNDHIFCSVLDYCYVLPLGIIQQQKSRKLQSEAKPTKV